MKARFAPAVLLVSGALLWAPAAGAKDLAGFKVCGAKGCAPIGDRALLRSLFGGIQAQREAPRVSTPRPAPFLRFEYWVRGDRGRDPSFVQYYVPSRGVLEVNTGPSSWTWIRSDATAALFQRVSRRATPFPVPKISAVTISGKAARDPASYVRLFSLQNQPGIFPDEPDWQRIVLRTRTPSPWSTNAATLEYSKSTNVLWRGNEFVQVPPAIAARLEARASLRLLH